MSLSLFSKIYSENLQFMKFFINLFFFLNCNGKDDIEIGWYRRQKVHLKFHGL